MKQFSSFYHFLNLYTFTGMNFSVLGLIAVTLALFLSCDGAGCKLSDKKLKRKGNIFTKKCLNKGFSSGFEGCVTQGSNNMKKLQLRRCNKLNKQLAECDFTCIKPVEVCNLSDKKQKRVGKMFEKKCLNKGFASEFEGCDTIGSNKLSKRPLRRCNKLNQKLAACDYNCLEPVDGGWSVFGDWSGCSAECGGGTQTRSKTCTNPAPVDGGADCQGDAEESRTCNPDICAVDGGWSVFGDWSGCSAECGGGTQTRSKTCTNPAPVAGGADCQGDAEESSTCNIDACPLKIEDLGCWKDTGTRAIPALDGKYPTLMDNYWSRSNAYQKCLDAANDLGYKVFALQHSGWCASGPGAEATYKKYGASNACKADGEGGWWANQVYKIVD